MDLMSESRQRLNRVHFAGFGPPRRRCRGGERRITKKRTPVHTHVRTYVYTELSGQRKLLLRTCSSVRAPRPPRPRQKNVHSAWLQYAVIMEKWPTYHVVTRARRQPLRPPSPPSAEHETLYQAVLPLVPFPSVPGLANPFSPLPHSAGACGVRWWWSSGVAVIGVGVMRGWVDGRWVVGWWVGGLVGGYVGGVGG